ncbi:MAG: hypothetical protein KF860_16510 [Cyclobacteriaceae bacterium]|jgi:hypothetical protein|nr:hypothetical protein [Cyclobacteriaceae bacterium]
MGRLEYSKEILQKLSFDKSLLEKEYPKLIKLLTSKEIEALNAWYRNKFGIDPDRFLNTKK